MHHADFGPLGEEFSHRLGAAAMTIHANRQRLQASRNQVRVHRGQAGAGEFLEADQGRDDPEHRQDRFRQSVDGSPAFRGASHHSGQEEAEQEQNVVVAGQDMTDAFAEKLPTRHGCDCIAGGR